MFFDLMFLFSYSRRTALKLTSRQKNLFLLDTFIIKDDSKVNLDSDSIVVNQ